MLSKEKFIKYINQLKELSQEMDKINKAYQNSKFLSLDISCGEYEELIINMLEDIFQDTQDEWINYFIYELEYGEKYEDLMITDENGKDIPLRDAEDLYNLLMENHKF